MKTRRLGNTDLQVTEIGLGTNAVGGHNLFTNLRDSDGEEVVRRALDQGVNFFDTADVYGFGRSEQITGQALGDRKNEVIVATKGAIQWDQKQNVLGINNDPAYLRQALEASLKRLGRDYVDLYYIHWPDPEVRTPLADAYGEVLRLKEEGKTRYAGVSNFSVDQLKEAMKAGPIDALQMPYSILNREVESEILPFCEQHGIGFIPYGPIAFGLLAGKYGPDFKPEQGDWRNDVPLFQEGNFPRNLEIVDELKKLADARGVPVAHLAMRWVLRSPIVASTITGAKRAGQVDENVGAVGWDLTADELARIDELTQA